MSDDPPPVKPSEDTDLPGAAPHNADEPDEISPREKRKMAESLDAFVERD